MLDVGSALLLLRSLLGAGKSSVFWFTMRQRRWSWFVGFQTMGVFDDRPQDAIFSTAVLPAGSRGGYGVPGSIFAFYLSTLSTLCCFGGALGGERCRDILVGRAGKRAMVCLFPNHGYFRVHPQGILTSSQNLLAEATHWAVSTIRRNMLLSLRWILLFSLQLKMFVLPVCCQ